MRAGGIALLVWAVAGLAAAHEPPAEPPLLYEPPAAGSYSLPVYHTLAEHWLLDADAKRAPVLGLAAGEAALVSFVYGRCHEACPLALATLRRLDRTLAETPELSRRTRLVTVSFDPDSDDPARMAELRAHMEPRGRWAFLTAPDAATLAPVLADFGQRVFPATNADGSESGRLEHVLKVFLVDADKNVRNIYSTGFLEPILLRNDVATVLGISP
jgi:cytochrome c peroxidase